MLSLLKRCDFYIFILLISIFFTPSISFSDANKIFKENSNAVVVIVTYDAEGNPVSQGSGFVVRSDGAIVTNYHVISNAEDIKVKIGDKVLKVEGLLHIDKENDIVILKAEAKELPIVKIEDKEMAEVGDRVYVISSPHGLENTVSDGVLSGIREIDSKRKILQITAPVSEGGSGSPVFNKNGEVIGIATFFIKAQNLNFAMPINLIKDKVSAKKVIALKEAEIEDYKKTAEYWFYLGYHLYEDGLYKEAIDAYKHAIQIKPDYAEAHLGLGVTYLLQNDTSSALDVYKILKDLDPDLANKLFDLVKASQNNSETTQLICTVMDSDGKKQRDISLKLDYTNKRVNGFPADITDAEVRWVDREYWYTLNRYSGSIVIDAKGFPGLASGKCYKPTERQF